MGFTTQLSHFRYIAHSEVLLTILRSGIKGTVESPLHDLLSGSSIFEKGYLGYILYPFEEYLEELLSSKVIRKPINNHFSTGYFCEKNTSSVFLYLQKTSRFHIQRLSSMEKAS